jgi:hypothetical protein
MIISRQTGTIMVLWFATVQPPPGETDNPPAAPTGRDEQAVFRRRQFQAARR